MVIKMVMCHHNAKVANLNHSLTWEKNNLKYLKGNWILLKGQHGYFWLKIEIKT